jgi:hypothetical protein
MRTLAALTIVAAFASCAPKPEAKVKLKDQTYAELLLYPAADRVILAGRVGKTAFVQRGSRSERVIIDVSVLAGTPELTGKAVALTRFSQGDPIVKVEKTYLFAAYRGEWSPAWALVEAVPIEESNAQAEVKAATEELLKASKNNR